MQAHEKNTPVIFKYIETVKDILERKGLDFMFNNCNELSIATFKKFTSMCYNDDFNTSLMCKSSLKYYRCLKSNTKLSAYLCAKSNFHATRIKFQLRTGISGIGEDLFRQKRGSGNCTSCGQFETLKHVLLYCNKYSEHRLALYNSIKLNFGDIGLNLFMQNSDYALSCLLGDNDDLYNKLFLEFITNVWRERSNMNANS